MKTTHAEHDRAYNISMSFPKKEILHIGITDGKAEEVLEYVIGQAVKPDTKCMIVTPNPEIIIYANKHEHFRQILNQAQISLCDGIGLHLASKFLGQPLPERIAGVDFMENLCKRVVRKPITVGFLGGRGNVAIDTAECLKKRYPGLTISFVGQEWDKATQERLSRSVVDILFVAFGFPKQEEWIITNLAHLPVKVAMGVGGAFDYLSGNITRAPFFVRAIGGEWLFRLIRQPWRAKRQLALFSFILLVLKAKIQRR